MTKQERMALDIVSQINKLFDEESEDKKYDAISIDWTDFFTALVKASAYIFNEITEEDKNFLEFTHLANQLIVQDMMNRKGEKTE